MNALQKGTAEPNKLTISIIKYDICFHSVPSNYIDAF